VRDQQSSTGAVITSDRPSTLATVAGVVVASIAAAAAGVAFAQGSSRLFMILPIAAAGCLAMAALAVYRFEAFVVAIIALRATLDYAKLGEGAPAGLDPAALVSALFLMAGAVWLAAEPSVLPSDHRSRLVRPLAAFVAAAALSLPFSGRVSTSGVELVRIATIVVILAVLDRLLVDRRRMRMVLAAVFVSALLPIAAGAFQLLTGQGRVDVGGFSRIRGTFLHPNPFAIYLTMLLILGVALFPHLTRLPRLAMGAFALSASVLLLFTYTRSAWIAVMLGLLVVAWIQSKRLVVLLAVSVVVVAALVPSAVERFQDLDRGTRPSGATGNSLDWRFQYWGQTLALAENPVFGIGLKEVEARGEDEAQPHNDFVRVFVETGLVGLTAYLWFVVALLATARRSLRRTFSGIDRGVAVGFAGVVAAFLALSIVSNIISQLVLHWYFAAIAACAVAAGRSSPVPTPAPSRPGPLQP
jgi:putative inorganic carbon (hco3(-)) transporter